MIQRVTEEQIQEIYKKHMRKDFPAKERCSYKEFVKGYDQENLLVYSYTQEDVPKVYFVFSQTDQTILLQYFAVFKEYRGIGIGTRALEEFLQVFAKQKVVCLEIEDSKKSRTKKQKDIRSKRKRFYERMGFRVHPGIQRYNFFTAYELLSMPDSIPATKIKEEILKIYTQVYSKKITNHLIIELKEEGNIHEYCQSNCRRINN